MSQLLHRLQKELTICSDPIDRAEIMARIACNLARVGRFDEAKKAVTDLRAVYSDGRSGRVMVWIMLAEALIIHYNELGPLAYDRIMRAQLLGVAMNYQSFIAISSAWKAYLEFERSNYAEMVKSLNLAQTNANVGDHDSHVRIAIVLSCSFMICGVKDKAQKWFMQGRDHALKIGDQASIEAMVFNKAVFTLAWLRIRRCSIELTPDELKMNHMEVRSARNFQDLLQSAVMSYHIKLCEARLLILEEKFAEAAVELYEVKTKAPFAKNNFSLGLIDLEISYCLLNSSKQEEALVLFETISPLSFEDLDLDEKMVAAWIRWQMSKVDDRFGEVATHKMNFEELRVSYEDSMSALVTGLAAFSVA